MAFGPAPRFAAVAAQPALIDLNSLNNALTQNQATDAPSCEDVQWRFLGRVDGRV